MPTIRKSLLQLTFSGSYMKRWNDKLRPIELVEVDKQAHKMMIAWLIFMLSSEDMAPEERTGLGDAIVEGGIFEYLYRLIITDIKPPVFYRIKTNSEHYRMLTDWVLEQLRPRVLPMGEEFCERMSAYLRVPEHTDTAGRILSCAHLFASRSEFQLLKGVNEMDEELESIEAGFAQELSEFEDLPGVSALLGDDTHVLTKLMRLYSRLRFQKRWSQTPRIPETSVLGHMFIVAMYAWFFSLELNLCPAGRQNNFFGGLFHDLPELLTRDIISPVKRAARPIGEFIKEYEEAALLESVLTPLVKGGYEPVAERLRYFLGLDVGSEFTPTVRDGEGTRAVDGDEVRAALNRDDLDPKDGELIKMCDNLAAFIEAYTALKNGIASDQLHAAQWRIRRQYLDAPVSAGVHIGALLADFD